MYGAVDVHYLPSGGARSALILSENELLTPIVDYRVDLVPHVEDYTPGQFFRRELPAVRGLLTDLSDLQFLVIDGYVDLDVAETPGLGRYVHQEFGWPVIGVAKSPYRSAVQARAVTRGKSARPLFVTAVGVSADRAADVVLRMCGVHRIPEPLRIVDGLARGRNYDELAMH